VGEERAGVRLLSVMDNLQSDLAVASSDVGYILSNAGASLVGVACAGIGGLAAIDDTHYVSGDVPPVNFVTAPPNPLGPREVAPFAIKGVYRNGNFYTVGSFYNVFTGATVPG
jgi:hypothetical protein